MLNLILGRQGTGKSTFIYKSIAKDIKDNKDTYLIVPEQYSFEAEKEIINVTGSNGVMGINILSFSRLCFKVLNKAGSLSRQPLSKKAALIILKKILLDLSDELVIYSKNCGQEGFCEILYNCITDFKKNRVKYTQLSALDTSGLLNRKINEIQKIYESFENYISSSFYDAQDLAEQAIAEISNSGIFKNANVYIDGFYTLDKQSLSLLECIMRRADNLTVAVTYEDDKQRDVFSICEKLKSDLTNIALDTDVKVNIIKLSEKKNCSKAVRHIEENIFKYPYKIFKDDKEILPQVCILNNAYEEAEYVARAIINFVQEKNLRYKDIAIFTNNLDQYGFIVQRIFDEYEIPYFIDERYDISGNSLPRMILSLLNMISGDKFYYKDVFEYLKTGYVNLADDEISKLENYVLKYNIKRTEYFYDFYKADNADKVQIDEFNNIRKKFIENIESIYADFKSLKNYDQIAEFVEKILDSDFIAKKIAEGILFCEENSMQVQCFIEQQIMRIVKESLEFIKYFLKDQKASIQDFCAVFKQTLEDEKAGVLPLSADCVIIGDFERSRISQIKAAFILGAVEGNMPKKIASDGIFTQIEKQHLMQKGLNITGEAQQHNLKEIFYIYNVMSKPSQYLFITAPELSQNGEDQQLCSAAEQILKMFDIKPVFPNNNHLSVLNAKATYKSLIAQIRNNIQNNEAPDGKACELFAWFSNNEKFNNKTKLLEKALKFDNEAEDLSKEDINAIKSNALNLSASSIETFAECAFKYFIKYTLKARQKEIWQINALDIGNLIHGTSDKFTKQILKNNTDLKTITDEQIECIVDLIIEQSEQDFKNGVFDQEGLNKAMLKKAGKIAKKTLCHIVNHAKNGDFKISGSEIEFGANKQLPAVHIGNYQGIDIYLEGKIDRVDTYIHNGKTYYKIFDYKTGNIDIDYEKIFYGTDMQLLLYMHACLSNKNEHMPAGMFYYKFDLPVVKYEKELNIADINKIIFQNMRFYGIATNNEEIIMAIDKNAKDNEKRSCRTIKYKSDNTISKSAHVFSDEEMKLILNHSIKICGEFAKQILRGYIRPNPYKTSCIYCGYKSICNFDICFEKNNYKKMDAVSKDTIIEKIKGSGYES